MSKLMDELMAEAQRINALEVEVERTVDRQKAEIQQCRKDKLHDIHLFLDKMHDALIEADAMRMPDNGPTFVVLNNVWYDDDGYNRNAGIIFYKDNIYFGGHYPQYGIGCGCGSCSRNETLSHALLTGGNAKVTLAIVDAWSPKIENDIEEAIASYIKCALAKRMEKMRKELQKSNDEYLKYVKE